MVGKCGYASLEVENEYSDSLLREIIVELKLRQFPQTVKIEIHQEIWRFMSVCGAHGHEACEPWISP